MPLEGGGANKWWNLMPTHGALPNHSLPRIPDPHAAGRVLDPPFREHLGLNYAQLINFLKVYIESEAKPTGVVPKAKIIRDLKKNFNITVEQATKRFTASVYVQPTWKIERYLAPSRNTGRGFFEFIHNDIPVLFFSRTMALDALNILINNTCYQKLPEEWKTPDIETHLTTLSNKAGKWFEYVVSNSLAQVGIHAMSSVERYRSQGKIITPPENVGEIDFIGYLEEHNALFVIEARTFDSILSLNYFVTT